VLHARLVASLESDPHDASVTVLTTPFCVLVHEADRVEVPPPQFSLHAVQSE